MRTDRWPARLLDELHHQALQEHRRRGFAKRRYLRRKSGVQRLRIAIIAAFGSRCKTCGFDDPRALQIDHVANDGKQDRERFSHQYAYYRHVLDVGPGHQYQLLCANCNAIKAYEAAMARHRMESS